MWVDKGLENARATSAIARLKNADADGLEASDYKTPNFAGLTGDALAEADLKLTQAVLTYARHVQAGRFAYTYTISPYPNDKPFWFLKVSKEGFEPVVIDIKPTPQPPKSDQGPIPITVTVASRPPFSLRCR